MPLVYWQEPREAAASRVLARINELCDEMLREKSIQCSPQFRALIFNVRASIVDDPSPSWDATANDREEQYRNFLNRLPEILRGISETESVGRKLTYFEGLHWLSSNLDSFCPFDKSPQRRPQRGRER